MAALDLFGRRWMLRVVWELRNGPIGFRALITECEGISAAVLRERVLELLDSQLAFQDEERRYLLTPLGEALLDAIAPLDQWSRKWAKALAV
jgi:DNA-binding HxlR family transcriptional regulator